MKLKILSFALALFTLASCTQEQVEQKLGLREQTTKKLSEMAAAGKLSTVEYTITKMVKASDDSTWKIGDRKILFSCNAYLEGGIDMARYDASKVIIDETTKSISLTLPKAELISFNMPYNEVKLQYEKVTGLRTTFGADERNHALQLGESSIRKSVEELGILADAEKNARQFFTSMLKQLGYQTVTVKFE